MSSSAIKFPFTLFSLSFGQFDLVHTYGNVLYIYCRYGEEEEALQFFLCGGHKNGEVGQQFSFFLCFPPSMPCKKKDPYQFAELSVHANQVKML